MSIVLVGYRGCGKTSVGRLLAERLRCELLDTDALIVARAGMTIREIFAQSGEPHFRQLESAALDDALAKRSTILSTGGGIILSPANRQKLKASARPVVYLACPPEVLLQRIQGDAASAINRPNLTSLGGGLDEVRQMLTFREPLYREVATLIIDAASHTPTQLADEILKQVR